MLYKVRLEFFVYERSSVEYERLMRPSSWIATALKIEDLDEALTSDRVHT